LQQPIAPVERGTQCALSGRHIAQSTGKETQGIVETGEDISRREHGTARSGKLDGQGQAIKTAADFGHDRHYCL
jgi:hypothetical protein